MADRVRQQITDWSDPTVETLLQERAQGVLSLRGSTWDWSRTKAAAFGFDTALLTDSRSQFKSADQRGPHRGRNHWRWQRSRLARTTSVAFPLSSPWLCCAGTWVRDSYVCRTSARS